jgi:hypothetical protein
VSRLKVGLLAGACAAVLVVGGLAITHVTQAPETADAHPAFDQQSLWQAWRVYCYGCHAAPSSPGGVNLLALDEGNLGKDPVVWEKVLRKIRMREMPPAGAAQPDAATYEQMVSFIENGRERSVELNPNPGRPTLHRLNRSEYANAVRDLLALEIDAAELLPADDIGYGFDNIGDVLTVSPLLLERYLSAASKVSRAAIGDTAMPVQFQTYTVPHGLAQIDRMNDSMPFGSRGGSSFRHHFPVDGEYEISVKLQTGRFDQVMGLERERKLDMRIDGDRLGRFTIAADARAGQIHGAEEGPDAHLRVRVPVKAGTRTISATFLKDTVLPEGIALSDREQAFFEGVGSVSVAGPYNAAGPGATPSRERIFACRPASVSEERPCAEKIIGTLARRAYRRPIGDDDLPQLLRLYDDGAKRGGFEVGIQLALQKILVSPEFIFRVELDPEGAAPGSVHRVSDLELASRLSFFLWSSIPDDELLAVAERGELKNEAMLEAQVKRMLADPRSQSLVTNFAGQWLFLRNIARIQPDPAAFPNFDDNLRDALRQETELLIQSMLREDKSVGDLLDADYTFVNQRLAEHYGIPGVYGTEFRRVPVSDENRRGLLGHASILTVTSYPNRTAPTIRGKWVLEQLLGTPPPPPPPNVPTLAENEGNETMTMRERMEVHRTNPACAACHRVMDPMGFALENFDGLGRWRDTAGGVRIDASGALPDGTTFNGAGELRKVLLGKKDMFVETFTERLLTYALGRGVEPYDQPVVRKIAREAKSDDQRWSSIILGIVKSVPFQMRVVSDGDT